MNRYDLTTLGNLRTGDRFVFPKKLNEVLQTTGAKCTKKGYVAYNKINEGGLKHDPYDHESHKSTQVKFIRHTRLVPGKEWLLEELSVGDVFFMLTDVITEYQVLQKRSHMHDTIIQDVAGVEPSFESPDMGVVFVRSAEEVKA